MAKDPAFLFYASDFLTGTMFMNNEQVGIYVRLLCAQHQHGAMIDKISFNSLVGNNDIIRAKFIECENGFYNERLISEMEKRNKKSENISAAAFETWKKRKENTKVIQSYKKSNTKVIRIENENEDVIKDIIRSIDKYRQDFENDFKLDEKVVNENRFSVEQLAQARLEFWNSKELDVEMQGKPYQDVQKHFLNWCRKNKDRLKREETKSKKNGKPTAMDYLEINRLANLNISDE